jgi:hypothetical protein
MHILNAKKNFILTIFLLFVSIGSVINITCKNNPVDPADNIQPGRRDYVWSVDSLVMPEGGCIPGRIWGSSAYDIWTAGMTYLNAYGIWHYDGTNWKNYDPISYIDPRGIFGFSRSNIWLGSTDGAIWNYDGVKWSKYCQTIIPNYKEFVNQDLSGSAPDNLYAVGFADSIDGKSYKAIIFHFNGSTWNQVNIPVIYESFSQIFYNKSTKQFLIHSWNFTSSQEHVYSFNGKELKKIFTTNTGLTINQIGDQINLTTDNKIYKFINGNFEIFKDFNKTEFAGRTWGRSDKDFFTVNWDGIGHYNGSDLVTIYKKWNGDWSPKVGLVYEKDVFFIWQNLITNINYVIHGKLN